MSVQPDYDLCVIGGGINGAGIARDAAGRGLSVLLVEAQDLAQGTSSASTKLIHGGLRYLEHGEFRLVRESLNERKILMRVAPHLVRPMEFVMPHVSGLRPKWMIGLGLWLYDRVGGGGALPKSSAVSLHDSLLGEPLKKEFPEGFKYADCWTNDARLVILNAMDARERGAEILTRTACIQIGKSPEGSMWHVRLKDLASSDEFEISAKMVVNAAGPWVKGVLDASGLSREATPKIRLVKGSHIVVPRLYDGEHAYLLQQPDKRVVFTIPFEEDFTLVGTTDEPYEDEAIRPSISAAEKEYLCEAVNRFFDAPIGSGEIVWSYSGVRALFDDGQGASQNVTRDYRLDMDAASGPPLLSVFGGKLTTYRALAEHAVDKITGAKNNKGWTKKSPLPGGDITGHDLPGFIEWQEKKYNFVPREVLRRYACVYGTRMDTLLDGIDNLRGMGRDFGGGLYEAEVLYLIRHEFAKTADDILWRRTKLGLHLEKKTILALEAAMPDYVKARKAA